MRATAVSITGTGSSAVVPMDRYLNPFSVGLGVTVTGTVNYTVQHTFDDIFDSTVTPVWFNHPVLLNQIANLDGNYAFPVRAIKVVNNSGSGTTKLTILQAGAAG